MSRSRTGVASIFTSPRAWVLGVLALFVGFLVLAAPGPVQALEIHGAPESVLHTPPDCQVTFHTSNLDITAQRAGRGICENVVHNEWTGKAVVLPAGHRYFLTYAGTTFHANGGGISLTERRVELDQEPFRWANGEIDPSTVLVSGADIPFSLDMGSVGGWAVPALEVTLTDENGTHYLYDGAGGIAQRRVRDVSVERLEHGRVAVEGLVSALCDHCTRTVSLRRIVSRNEVAWTRAQARNGWLRFRLIVGPGFARGPQVGEKKMYEVLVSGQPRWPDGVGPGLGHWLKQPEGVANTSLQVRIARDSRGGLSVAAFDKGAPDVVGLAPAPKYAVAYVLRTRTLVRKGVGCPPPDDAACDQWQVLRTRPWDTSRGQVLLRFHRNLLPGETHVETVYAIVAGPGGRRAEVVRRCIVSWPVGKALKSIEGSCVGYAPGHGPSSDTGF